MRTLPCLALAVLSAAASAATGVCDVSAGDNGPSELACVAAINALGANTVVADIFHDSNGKTGDQLPVYGKLVNPFVGCPDTNNACNGSSVAGQTVPGAYVCENAARDFATVASYVETLDWRWSNPYRMLDAHGVLANGCPDWSQSVVDGNKEGYKPWEGLVFDLGGPSNRVVLFPINDHGPQPCESVEYTVYLTNNLGSRDKIENPTTTGADPTKWNRAKLSKIYLEGWKKLRAGVDPGLNYTIEADSFTSVWSLPCGITFRYVGVISGNDGKDIPECNFDSSESELDAVAGLTEGGAGVCPDADRDGFVDCNCNGHPVICDCNDANAMIHPGAAEACDDADLNCDGKLSGCLATQVCDQKQCRDICGGEIPICPPGQQCKPVDGGFTACKPNDCTTASCPLGTTCDAVTKTCRPSCSGVTCPITQICREGLCVDPCANIVCPSPLLCVGGACQAPCSCFNLDTGCPTGLVCDRPVNACVTTGCQGKSCTAPQVCNLAGVCQNPCDMITCPATQKCDAAKGGCVGNCAGVTCGDGGVCNPPSGACVEPGCVNVSCVAPATCKGGACTSPPVDGGAGGGGGQDGGGTGGGSGGGSGATGGGKGGGGGTTVARSSCGCSSSGGLLAMIGLLAGVGLNRRKRLVR